MKNAAVVRLSMAASGFMLAYQVASKAVRDAVFLSAWPATALPTIVIAAAVVSVAMVPLFARLLARFGPAVVVPAGFLFSAAAHAIEWRLSASNPWVAAAVYLHAAALGALLLSGVWSFVSELFDPQSARRSYVQIAGAGTLGGILGGVGAIRTGSLLTVNDTLLLLAGAHVVCALLTFVLGLTARRAAPPTRAGRVFHPESLRAAPYLKTVAAFVVVGTATAAILDYLLKWHASQTMTTAPALLHFFAVFYTVTQVATFVAQVSLSPFVAKLGVGRSTGSLPGGVAISAGAALLFPAFPMFAIARAVELILRGSTFRSGYELLFTPLAPEQKRRTKAVLDVACDRAGDAVGALIVQALLIAAPAFIASELLAAALALAVAGIWISRRLDGMYVQVVGRRLVQAAGPPTIVGTEPLWTVFDASTLVPPAPPRASGTTAARTLSSSAPSIEDKSVAMLAVLRSRNPEHVRSALDRLAAPDTIHVVQAIQLLAWDDVLEAARRMIERSAESHTGLLVDNLVNTDNDFAIRRRIPRLLGALSSQRALDGLVCGLDDARFEVRYQCSHAIDRVLRRSPRLAIDRNRILAVVERELSVDPAVWHAYRLLDRPETDPAIGAAVHACSDFLQHVFVLLAAVWPREEILVAMRGVGSADPLVKSLAFEYLERVLPPSVRGPLWAMLDRVNT